MEELVALCGKLVEYQCESLERLALIEYEVQNVSGSVALLYELLTVVGSRVSEFCLSQE